MIRSEKDFLENLLLRIRLNKHGLVQDPDLMGKIEEMVEGRLVIYSGKTEPGVAGTVAVADWHKFVPVEVQGKPLSEMIIEDRR